MAAGVIVFLVYIFSQAMFGTRGESVRETFEMALPKLAAGEMRRFKVNGRDLILLHRDEQMKHSLSRYNKKLYAADAQKLDKNPADWFVAYGFDPLLGCPIDLSDSRDFFQARCSPQQYDLAGRPYKNQQSQRNLIVPEYEIREGKIIIFAD